MVWHTLPAKRNAFALSEYVAESLTAGCVVPRSAGRVAHRRAQSGLGERKQALSFHSFQFEQWDVRGGEGLAWCFSTPLLVWGPAKVRSFLCLQQPITLLVVWMQPICALVSFASEWASGVASRVVCADCVSSEHTSELCYAFRRSAPESLTIQKLTGPHAMVDRPSIH